MGMMKLTKSLTQLLESSAAFMEEINSLQHLLSYWRKDF